MSVPILDDYERRRDQVKRYLALISKAELENKLGPGRRLSVDRLHLLRAGCFLILYNLIEASARGAIDAIHDDMAAQRVPFSMLAPNLRREVVKGFKRRADPDKHADLVDLPVDFVSAALDVDYQFSGNVDAKLIRSIAELYGFSSTSDSAKTHAGNDLLTIKTNRNDLAHGNKTYDEVGRGFTTRDLLAISIRSTAFMRQILINVDNYIKEKAYRVDRVS